MQRITFWHGFILIFSFLIVNISNGNEIKTIPPLDIILEKAHAYSVDKNNSIHKLEYLINHSIVSCKPVSNLYFGFHYIKK